MAYIIKKQLSISIIHANFTKLKSSKIQVMKKLILSILVISLVKISVGQTEIPRAQANFIYNFTKFFDWPQSEKTGDFVIGVLGSRTLANELTKVTKGKKNVTQNIVVKYFGNENDVTKCHVIYIDALKSKSISNIHTKTGIHCLIISNSVVAIENGSIIKFVLEGERLIYEFSKTNALKHGLKFHSKVSEMATKTH